MVSVEVHYRVEKVGFKRQMKVVEDTEMRGCWMCQTEARCTFIPDMKETVLQWYRVSDSRCGI
jgi:hypothetical protein